MFINKTREELEKLKNKDFGSEKDRKRKYKQKTLAEKIIFEENRTFISVKNVRRRFYCAEDQQEKMDHIKDYHDVGHFGIEKMVKFLNTKIYGVTRDEVKDIVSHCVHCLAMKTFSTKPPIKPIIAKNSRDRYVIDMIDLRSYANNNNGYSWALVLVDSFSKFGQVIPCKTKTGLEVLEGLELLFSYIGPPKILHSDNGGEFKNPLMRSLCERWEIKQIHGRPKAPWVQGQCERLNQTLKKAMSKTAKYKNTPSKRKNI